jgi:ABC-type cobalamin/Fe3+-siderophores transport system ATPase subunit
MIELTDVTAGYEGGVVLSDVNLSIRDGERVALVGPNGAGKSTLLRLISGLLAPTAGEVLLDGRPVRDLSRQQVARRIAVVPQVATLPFAARVEEVVALGRLPHEDPLRGPRERDRAAVAAAVEQVGLGQLADRDARELSLGERQLVLVAVAVAQQAPTILLDEPTVHLDIRHQVDVMELLAGLNRREGTTIVAVLHDLGLAARYFPRVVVVANGGLATDGPVARSLSREVIRQVFAVDPQILVTPWNGSSAVQTRMIG